jgi:hypothetical protein
LQLFREHIFIYTKLPVDLKRFQGQGNPRLFPAECS